MQWTELIVQWELVNYKWKVNIFGYFNCFYLFINFRYVFAFYFELVAPQNLNLAISAWSLGNSWKKHKETPFTGCFITWRTKNKYKEAERVGLQIDLLVEEMEQKIT